MFESRTLGRRDSLLRDAASSTNLASNLGAWFTFGPPADDEVWTINALELTIAGKGLLASFAQMGDANGQLEFGFEIVDGLGYRRDIAPITLHTVETKADWQVGVLTRSAVDSEAGLYEDEQPRVGLRGIGGQQAGAPVAVWEGPATMLRGGHALSGVTWQIEPVRDIAGAVIANGVKLTIETAQVDSTGALAWTGDIVQVAANAQEILAGRFDFAPPIAADAFRWRVELQFLDVGANAAAHDPRGRVRTGTVFLLGAWIVLDSFLWSFDRLADLTARATTDRVLQPGGWDGAADLMLLRLDCSLSLSGLRKERLCARLKGAQTAFQLFEVHPVARLAFVDVS